MLLPLMNQIAISLLLSAATLLNPTTPTTPKNLTFDASAYVTVNNEIRVAVQKTADVPVVILLRGKDHQVLFQQSLGKEETRYAMKLNVDELGDGQYELEVKSSEGSIIKELNVSTQPVQKVTRIVAVQ